MILAIDVHYKETYAKAVGVLFDWEDEKPTNIIVTQIEQVAEYESGQFYKRELPCISHLLQKIDLSDIQYIIVDGHVYVNNDKTLGLGGHLYKLLNEKIPVIGVAKKSFINTHEVSFPIYRGQSKVPLYVSAIGTTVEMSIQKVQNMFGKYRIPDILKILDMETKNEKQE